MKTLLRLGVLFPALPFLLVACQENKRDEHFSPIIPPTVEYEDLFVSLAEAEEIAQLATLSDYADTFGEEVARKGHKKRKIRESKIFKDKRKREAFYLFNYEEGNGFAIISADKRMAPLLAYDDSSEFDLSTYDQNPGVVTWIESLKDHVTHLRDDSGYRRDYLERMDNANRSRNSVLNGRTANSVDPDPCNRPGSDCGSGRPLPVQTWLANTGRL